MADPWTCQGAFRYGFLRRCAEEGLGPDAAQARAAAGLGLLAQPAVKRADGIPIIGPLLRTAMGIGGIGLGASALAGALGGHLLARAQTPEIDPEAIRDRELIQAYDTYAQEARLRSMARRLKPARKAPFPRY